MAFLGETNLNAFKRKCKIYVVEIFWNQFICKNDKNC
jgi:hypothetical protein